MHILSFDCANRSLAVCFISINLNLPEGSDIDDKKYAQKCINNNYVKIHIIKVFDLTKGKKTDTILRMSLLKDCLNNIDKLVTKSGVKIDQILIEYQMSANDKSRCVSNGILYHYSCIPDAKVSLVGPTLKNKICFSNDDMLDHGTFMEKYASKYTANKNHSKENFLYFLNIHGLTNLIQENNIAKKNIDDIADAFMQIWGWLEFGRS
jgi:hypothetical protein